MHALVHAVVCAARRSIGRFLTVLFVLFAGGVVLADQILELGADFLTTYLAPATNIQGVRPRHSQRGVNIDGSARAGGMFGLALEGNPFEPSLPGRETLNGVRLATGAFGPTYVDIALPSTGIGWVIGRTYNARQDSGGHHDSQGVQGVNWHQSSMPEIAFYDHPTDAGKDEIYLVYSAAAFIELQRAGSSSLEFKAKNGAAGMMQYAAGAGSEPDTFSLTDQNGSQAVFFGFDGDSSPAEGQLWKLLDVEGNVAFVGDESTGSTAISTGFDAAGRMTTAFDASGRRYSYAYSASDIGGAKRLQSVMAETKTGGTWASPTGVTTIATVEYDYYGDETYGDAGALKQVTTTLPLSDSGVNDIQIQYIRYWEGTFNASTNPGHPHAIKYIVEAEGTRNFDWSESGEGEPEFDEGYLTASNEALEPYASAYFQYDASHRISKAFFNGECGCGSSSNGLHEFEYETNSSYSDTSGYQTIWATRTIVKRPDGSYITQFFDETAQPLSEVITDADPDNTSPAPETWPTWVERNSDGQVTAVYSPANLSAYTHSDGTITKASSAGLIDHYVRVSSGDMKGFLSDHKHSKGTSGSQYLDGTWTWTSFTKTIGDVTITRPLVASSRVYSQEITSGTTGSYLTQYSYTAYTGSAMEPLAVEKIETTHPAVSTANNGSNTSTTESVHYRKDELPDFEKSPSGIITYHEYTNGQETKVIVDADTTSLSPPTGFSSSGTELIDEKEYAYDAQGRLTITTLKPGGVEYRKLPRYYTALDDRRLVTLDYKHYTTSGSTTYYGPIGYSVSNHAGGAGLSGTIAIPVAGSTLSQTSHIDESDTNALTAVDNSWSVEDVTMRIYNESGGRVESERTYHDVPSSGEGAEGTNFDTTFYGYDDMGRQVRVKKPHGTIERTTYDVLGREAAQYIGTNDSTFDGGEPTGTDNMVMTEETEYDSGNDYGNGYVTKRTLYVEDGDTDKREATFQHDLRGNVLLTTSPESPHTLSKFDNMGRSLASASYSSTGSIVVGTDDPTTETTNRLALSESFYDELGREWKSVRHGIDASDGSDDENLPSLRWYDSEGRLVKQDGPDLRKVFYDRLGRETHAFLLAVDNDTAYSDVDDVSGDIVLFEHQTTYDPATKNKIMDATISRVHDDKGGSETLGALDTNADGDALLYTASNLEGRIQITAYWYDSTDRLEEVVRYGTNGGSNFDRDGLSVPARSDTALRTSRTYDTDGHVLSTTDPRGLVTRFEYDDAGRQTKVIRNYTDGTPGGGANGDQDQTVAYAYTDGLRTTMTADLPSGETDQVTTYTFGTTKGTSAGDSKIATGDLLGGISYPDSTGGTDVVTYAYNAQNQVIYVKDQAGNVIEMSYDEAGREIHKRITTLASGFDGAVRRISTTYTASGQRELVTQYDNATVGSGSVVDEVKFSYGIWGTETKFEQDRNSAVGASGSVDDKEVTSSWETATTGRNTLRKRGMNLPSGLAILYEYSSGSDLHDDEASRVTRIQVSGTNRVRYHYNGVSELVGTSYVEADVMSNLYGTTSGTYPDLDRFNRVISSRWTKDNPGTDVDFYDVDISYDRNSNITQVEDNVHAGFDVIYSMDNLDRLTRAEEGTASGGSISSRKRDQQWTLTQTGNWDVGKLDLNGDGDFVDSQEWNDDRTHNVVNELTARDTDDNGTDNYTLVHDPVGNLTDDGEAYEYEHDPFGRLRKIKNTSTQALIAEYRYNGLGYRIGVHEDTTTNGTVDNSDLWYFFVYDSAWRIVATYREDTSTPPDPRPIDDYPKEQFLYHNAGVDGLGGSSYVDRVVFRDRDAETDWTEEADDTLEERIYICQNRRADVSALVNRTGSRLLEWVKYSSYGVPIGIPGADADSDFDVDSADETQVQTWISAPAYDVRGDVDLDGAVDNDDLTALQNEYDGLTLGWKTLSATALANRKGYAGYESDSRLLYCVRHRWLNSVLGRWLTRDQAGYPDGANLYQYAAGNPKKRLDPGGLASRVIRPWIDPPGASGTRDAGDRLCNKQTGGGMPTNTFYWEGNITINQGDPQRDWTLALPEIQQFNCVPDHCGCLCTIDGRTSILRDPVGPPPPRPMGTHLGPSIHMDWNEVPLDCSVPLHAQHIDMWHGDDYSQNPPSPLCTGSGTLPGDYRFPEWLVSVSSRPNVDARIQMNTGPKNGLSSNQFEAAMQVRVGCNESIRIRALSSMYFTGGMGQVEVSTDIYPDCDC